MYTQSPTVISCQQPADVGGLCLALLLNDKPAMLVVMGADSRSSHMHV